jgi:hypothetical protein
VEGLIVEGRSRPLFAAFRDGRKRPSAEWQIKLAHSVNCAPQRMPLSDFTNLAYNGLQRKTLGATRAARLPQ